jgi:hypothetical protein
MILWNIRRASEGFAMGKQELLNRRERYYL